MYFFIVAFLPVLILCIYIYKMDKNKEPKSLVLKLFFFGMLSCIPAFLLEKIFLGTYNVSSMNLISKLFYSFLGIALIEELCKFFVTYIFSYHHREFDEEYDIIVYATFVSLGFAFLENICYVYLFGYLTGLFRAILSVPFHACNGLFMGYYLCKAKKYSCEGNYKKERKNIFISYLMALITHGFYDFCIFSGNILFFIVFIIYVIYMYFYCLDRIKFVSKSSQYLEKR